MPPIPPHFSALEWRQIAGACEAFAEKDRARAAELAGNPAARGFVLNAKRYERLAERCMQMTRPE
jgi:hypothetical protein